MKKLHFVSFLMLSMLFIGAGCTQKAQKNTNTNTQVNQPIEEAKDSETTFNDSKPKEEVEKTVQSGRYEEFDESKIALAKENKTILFFKAPWCPTCRAVEKDILANKAEIPENVAILHVDYDTEIELRKKYKVTTQHTFVQIDENGAEIQSWRGGNTLNSIIERL